MKNCDIYDQLINSKVHDKYVTFIKQKTGHLYIGYVAKIRT